MWGLLKNELIKLRLRKKFLITAIVLGSLAALICLGVVFISKALTPDAQIQAQETVVTQLQKNKESAKSEEEKTQIDEQIKQSQQIIELIKNQPKADDPNWKSNLQSTIAGLETEVNAAPANTGEKENKRNQLITYKYLLEHDIRPMEPNSPKGINIITGIIALLGPLFIAIIIAIMSSDSVSAEFTPPTFKMLLTRPVTRTKVLASKFIASFIASTAVILSIELLVIILMGLFFGFGDPSYPIVTGTQYNITTLNALEGKTAVAIYNSSYITTLIVLVIKSLLLQIVYILAATSFFFMLSTLLKSSALSMSLSIVLVVAVNILGLIKYTKVISPFVFTSYGDTTSVFTGSTMSSTLSSLPTPGFAIFILLLWSIIPYVISHLTFTKRDILA